MSMKTYVEGRVTFQYYRKGNLWYKTANGFLFPVPVGDTGDADFLPEDKGIMFMRWIKAELKAQGIMTDKPPSSGKPQVDVAKLVQSMKTDANTGHGHVFERPDGVRMRCGGKAMCAECALDYQRLLEMAAP